MAKYHGILPFQEAFSGQMGGWRMGSVVGWEGWKVAKISSSDTFGAAMMPIGTHTMDHATLVAKQMSSRQ